MQSTFCGLFKHGYGSINNTAIMLLWEFFFQILYIRSCGCRKMYKQFISNHVNISSVSN